MVLPTAVDTCRPARCGAVLRAFPPHSCAAADNYVDAVCSWVASGANVNAVTDFGTTPMMMASMPHHASFVAELLRLGADARRVNSNGWTALHWVARRRGEGGGEVVKLLLAAGCDPTLRDNNDRTAVELATHTVGPEWGAEFAQWVVAP